MKFYGANEVTLVPILWRAARKLPTVVVVVDPFFPPLDSILRNIISALENRSRLTPRHDVLADLHTQWDHAAPLLANLYEELEPEINACFEFDRLARLPAPYSAAARAVVTGYISHNLATIHVVRTLASRQLAVASSVGGLTNSLLSLATGVTIKPNLRTLGRVSRRTISALVASQIAVIGLGRILRYLFAPRSSGKRYDLGVDSIGDESDYALCRELRNQRSIIFVGRKRSPAPDGLPIDLSDLEVCGTFDGCLTITDAISAAKALLIDTKNIWWAAGELELRLFFRVAALPVKRIAFEALLNRYPQRIFWSRDQYNAEHILRYHEIHKIGGEQWSVFNGCLSYTYLYPQLRYLSLDRFYAMTPEMFTDGLRKHWVPGMKVIGVETFRAARADYRNRSKDSHRDILFMSSIWTGRTEYENAIRDTARAFPDRTIYVQTKPAYRKTPLGDSFISALEKAAPNIVISDNKPYELFGKVKFAISDPSTVALEALQYGVFGFLFDIPASQKIAFHRNIEGFCVISGAELVSRIRSMEVGEWVYPMNKIEQLIRLDGVHFLDTVRTDMGLKPLAPPNPVWLSDISEPNPARYPAGRESAR